MQKIFIIYNSIHMAHDKAEPNTIHSMHREYASTSSIGNFLVPKYDIRMSDPDLENINAQKLQTRLSFQVQQ